MLNRPFRSYILDTQNGLVFIWPTYPILWQTEEETDLVRRKVFWWFIHKGPVKLIKQVKIAHSILQSVSNQFHFIILILPMQFHKWLSKNFSKPTSKNGDIGHFNL